MTHNKRSEADASKLSFQTFDPSGKLHILRLALDAIKASGESGAGLCAKGGLLPLSNYPGTIP
jgi:hypothetical protein